MRFLVCQALWLARPCRPANALGGGGPGKGPWRCSGLVSPRRVPRGAISSRRRRRGGTRSPHRRALGFSVPAPLSSRRRIFRRARVDRRRQESSLVRRPTNTRVGAPIAALRSRFRARANSARFPSRRRERLVSVADRRALFPLPTPRRPKQHGLHLPAVARGRAPEERLGGAPQSRRLRVPQVHVRRRPGASPQNDHTPTVSRPTVSRRDPNTYASKCFFSEKLVSVCPRAPNRRSLRTHHALFTHYESLRTAAAAFSAAACSRATTV